LSSHDSWHIDTERIPSLAKSGVGLNGKEQEGMAEELGGEEGRTTTVALIRRAVSRPYLFMAAILLVVGAIWFIRLAVEEFLLIDRVVNVYTNDAAVQMDTFAIRPPVTAQVLEVPVGEGDLVEKGQVLFRLVQDDFRAELQEASAEAEAIEQQLQEMRQQLPLSIERAEGEVARAQALVETKQQEYRRAQVFLSVKQHHTKQMQREHQATTEAAQARLREQETASREALQNLERIRQLFSDGIESQDRLDAAEIAAERQQARLEAAREQLSEAKEHFPGETPQMLRVHEQDVQRLKSEVKEQQTVLELARNHLRQTEQLGSQRLKVLEAKYKEALARVETYQIKLDKTTVYSPADGIVAMRAIEPGEMVEGDPSNPPVMIVNNPRQRWISANVWESDINRVRLGNTVDIWVDALKSSALGRGKPLQGKVFRINPTTYSEIAGLPPERFFTRRERKVPVGVSIEGDTPVLRAGMLAEVLIYPRQGAEAEER
jgi:multidrug resistance efflux pump